MQSNQIDKGRALPISGCHSFSEMAVLEVNPHNSFSNESKSLPFQLQLTAFCYLFAIKQ